MTNMIEMWLRGKSIRSSSDWFFMMDPLSYFLLQPVLHDWYKAFKKAI